MSSEPETPKTETDGITIAPMGRAGLVDAIESVSRGEIVMQMEFAQRFPRSIVQFKRDAMTLACEDEETAASCFYILPRGGKKIEGPSVRLAEIVSHCWRHMRVNTRDIAEDERYVRSQTIAWDMQANNAVGVEAMRRITDSNGKRYNDDMIQMTFAACRSVAFRNGVFKVVPFSFVKDIYEQCKATSLGKTLSMEQRRQKQIEAFIKLGLKEADVFLIAGVKGLADLTADHLVMLNGLRTSLKDGDTTLDMVMQEARTKPTAVLNVSLDSFLKADVRAENDPKDRGRESEKSAKG